MGHWDLYRIMSQSGTALDTISLVLSVTALTVTMLVPIFRKRCWLVGWLVGWFVCWLVGWLICCLVGWLFGWLVGFVVRVRVRVHGLGRVRVPVPGSP